MLQITQLREHKESTVNALNKKHFWGAKEAVDSIIHLDDLRRDSQGKLDFLLAEANKTAKEIGELLKSGQKEAAEERKKYTAELKTKSKEQEEGLKLTEKALYDELVKLPNLPHESVPEGKSPEQNEVVFESHAALPELNQHALPHWELIKKYRIIDFDLGSKITGAGFPVYIGKGARLQRALINFFLDEAIKAGYIEIQPPILVNEQSGFGTGQIPDKEGQMYFMQEDNLYLIPTAEVPITNIYRDVILKKEELPVKNAGYTPCFRREAGSWGAHVRGLNRLHQFDKVEIVQVQLPELSYRALEEMCAHVKQLLTALGLPFRILKLCGGDMGFAAALTYDFEVYSAAQKRWLEVSSVSNFESFQANRLKLRYKDEAGKPHLLHTLNGSAIALPRIVAALLENYQFDGGIRLPEVLHPYLGFDSI